MIPPPGFTRRKRMMPSPGNFWERHAARHCHPPRQRQRAQELAGRELGGNRRLALPPRSPATTPAHRRRSRHGSANRPHERVAPDECARCPPSDAPRLAAVLRQCRLFLGHDSGISHLAAAVGTPCVLLFGPTDPAVWAPANPQVAVVTAADYNLASLPVYERARAIQPML